MTHPGKAWENWISENKKSSSILNRKKVYFLTQHDNLTDLNTVDRKNNKKL